jgi:hypothetical protein
VLTSTARSLIPHEITVSVRTPAAPLFNVDYHLVEQRLT